MVAEYSGKHLKEHMGCLAPQYCVILSVLRKHWLVIYCLGNAQVKHHASYQTLEGETEHSAGEPHVLTGQKL